MADKTDSQMMKQRHSFRDAHSSTESETVAFRVDDKAHRITIEKCRLVVIEGADQGKEFVLDKPIIRIGTNERNDLVLEDETVSRFHCEVRRVGEEYALVDRQSTNGTYVGDLRLVEGVLYPQCKFQLGATVLQFAPLVEEVDVRPISGVQYGDIIGGSAAMQHVFGLIDKIAPSELSAVISGETGTGKELAARALHRQSARSEGPFVVFDCSAFPDNLLESELFGHERGAFSGAIKTHKGVFERANRGTLFLDELGEMAVTLQPKFLRALENGEIRRVGGERPIKVDVRVVAATNRNLRAMIDEGTFRQDLFYRLAKVMVDLPPLRKREGDLRRLAEHFLDQLRTRQPKFISATSFSAQALEIMFQYDWPGNVRELRNIVERAATFANADSVTLDDLPGELQARMGRTGKRRTGSHMVVPGSGLKEAKEQMITEFERSYLIDLLERNNMNITKVAREAGIDRRHVYRLLKKYGLEED